MSAAVIVKHNFETAHRLPFLGGKCTNLHGHSWWAEVTVTGQPDADGILLNFATLKRDLREWIDTNLDHGAMLGVRDPLIAALQSADSKVFVFGADDDPTGLTNGGGSIGRSLDWPTVENVAELLRRLVVLYLAGTVARPLGVSVRVTETAVNAATADGTGR